MTEGALTAASDEAGLDDDPADPVARARAKKSPNAFRTISEVADELHIAQHVLRFWETKFGQVRPLKRGGGRRYYRPDDIALLKRIADLLYFQGYTIKGVQRLLREGGGRLSDDIGPPTPDDHDHDGLAEPRDDRPPEPELPMPGLAAYPGAEPAMARLRPPRRVEESEVVVRPDVGEPDAGDRDAGEPAVAAGEAGRVAMLEGLLREVLEELQALRALLP